MLNAYLNSMHPQAAARQLVASEVESFSPVCYRLHMNNGASKNGKVIERLDRLERTMGQVVHAVGKVGQAVVALNHREAENQKALRQEIRILRDEVRTSNASLLQRLDHLIEATVRGRTEDAERFARMDRQLEALERMAYRPRK